MLALADKTNLEFLQRAISMSLDLVMKAALENLVHGREIPTVHTLNATAPFEAGQCIRERALAFGWGWAVETFGRLADEATVLAFVCAFSSIAGNFAGGILRMKESPSPCRAGKKQSPRPC